MTTTTHKTEMIIHENGTVEQILVATIERDAALFSRVANAIRQYLTAQ